MLPYVATGRVPGFKVFIGDWPVDFGTGHIRQALDPFAPAEVNVLPPGRYGHRSCIATWRAQEQAVQAAHALRQFPLGGARHLHVAWFEDRRRRT